MFTVFSQSEPLFDSSFPTGLVRSAGVGPVRGEVVRNLSAEVGDAGQSLRNLRACFRRVGPPLRARETFGIADLAGVSSTSRHARALAAPGCGPLA